jgi:hypothetical protein
MVEKEVMQRFAGQYDTQYWSLQKLSKQHKMANPDPSLGPNQVRYQAEFVDDATGEVYQVSVNFDPDTGLFGIIKMASGK